MRYVAVAQHDAFHCSGFQGAAPGLSWAVQKQMDMHKLSKRNQTFVERPPVDRLEGCDGIRADHPDVDASGGVLGQTKDEGIH